MEENIIAVVAEAEERAAAIQKKAQEEAAAIVTEAEKGAMELAKASEAACAELAEEILKTARAEAEAAYEREIAAVRKAAFDDAEKLIERAGVHATDVVGRIVK